MTDAVLERVQRAVDRITVLFHWTSLLLLVGIVLAVNADILGRVVFERPLAGVAELMGQTVVAFVFLQLPNTFRSNRLLRTDGIPKALARRCPGRARLLDGALHGLAIAILLPLIAALAPMVWRDIASGSFVGAVGAATIPVWPTSLSVMLGTVLLTLQVLLCAANPCAERDARTPVSL